MNLVKTGHSWSQIFEYINIVPDDKKALFLHFWEANDLCLNGVDVKTSSHACIIWSGNVLELHKSYANPAVDWFCIQGDFEELLSKYGLDYDTVYYPRNHELIADFFKKLETEVTVRKDFYEDICEMYISELFIHLSREITVVKEESEYAPKIQENLRFLRQKLYVEYNKKWNVDEMARLINISPSYLHATYKAMFGVSPINDLIEARIQQAKILLSESEMTINEIALNVGYSNSSHFIRQFVSRVGISPDKYRSGKLGGKD